jgi:hypothetical protein
MMRRIVLAALALMLAAIPAQAAILLPPVVITVAVSTAVAGPVITVPPSGLRNLTAQCIVTYGSSGTTIDAYLQTSLDGGNTWIDIRNFHATTSAFNNIVNLTSGTAVTTAVTPTDGSMSSNTGQDGIIGSLLRVKYKSSGTYAGNTTLACYAGGTQTSK